jgi:hypothetical protein
MRFFHVHANSRRRRNFIHSLNMDGQAVLDEQQKAKLDFSYFDDIMGSPPPPYATINLELLDILKIDARHLEERFTEAKVWDVIKALPPDKAPGSDGFTARFLQAAWDIIRPDIMMAFEAFWRLDMHNLHNVNEALITLLPKNPDAAEIMDYRPISLIHSIGKLILKVLVNRLAPRLNEVVHQSQSIFIKDRHIQDNFKLVQASAKLLHVWRKPSLMIQCKI